MIIASKRDVYEDFNLPKLTFARKRMAHKVDHSILKLMKLPNNGQSGLNDFNNL